MRVELTPAGTDEAKKTPAPKRVQPFSFRKSFRRFLLLLLLVVIAGAAAYVMTAPRRFNVLVIGSDQRSDERGRSDVLMLISVPRNPSDPATILTIPRDTRVDVAGYGKQKITHAYALGDAPDDGKNLGNRNLTVQTVEQFLRVPVHGTLELTFKSFADIVDQVGGVETDEHGHVDGEKALKIVRDRFREGGDFARTADQRDIFVQTVREVVEQKAVPSVYRMLQNSTESRVNVPLPSLVHFGVAAALYRRGNIAVPDFHNEVVPGKGASLYTAEFGKTLYYWIPDADGVAALVRQWLS